MDALRKNSFGYLEFVLSIVFFGCLSSCSGAGGGSSSALPTHGLPAVGGAALNAPFAQQNAPPAISTASVPVTMTYAFNPNATTTQSIAGARTIADATYTGYTSTAAPISISLNVTPIGGTVANYTGSCTAASTGMSGTCTVVFTAAPGPTTFTGALTAAGKTIATFSKMLIVAPGSANTINCTSNPVVSSVSLQLAATSVNAGTKSSTLLTVNANDANGNIIIGKASYVDSNGNPVAFLLNINNAQSGGNGMVTLQGPLRITSPGQAAIYAHYDGNWLDHADITVRSTSSNVSTLSGATLTTIPFIQEYSTGISPNADPYRITSGPDGNLWFTECGQFCGESHEGIGRITTTGIVTEFSSGISTDSYPVGITTGPDGNLWFLECGSYCSESHEAIARITQSGNVTEFISGLSNRASPFGITTGPDGNLWFTECGQHCGESHEGIGRITPTGVVTEFTTGITAKSSPYGIVTGPDGNLWFTECGKACGASQDAIGRVTTSGVITEFTTGLSASSSPYNIVIGPDGNLWFAECGKYCGESHEGIGRITTSGTITEFTSGISTNAGPFSITNGPDGNLWFIECGRYCGEAHEGIGRITTSGIVTEFTNGITANSFATDLTVGADGNIWFTEKNASQIGKLIL